MVEQAKRFLTPPRILVGGFALIILIGACLLMLPVSSAGGQSLSFVDALFTATSATCVTGLVVVDTASTFSLFGQIVILVLIQVGGLGFMTMATLLAFAFKRKISLKERLILQQAMNQTSMEGIVRLIRRVLIYSLIVEAAAAVIFAVRLSMDFGWKKGAYLGLFHAISFFNNAGFDLFGDFRSISVYVDDFVMNVVSMAIIMIGGIGFIVIADVVDYRTKNRRLSLHSKIVLSMSLLLFVVGAVVIFIFEFTNVKTIGSLNGYGKVLTSFFHSVSPRSAGVSSLNMSDLRQATQFFIIILMFIGGSPGSTGGGIKTTTFAVLIGAVIAIIRGKEDVVFFEYRLAKERVYKAVTLTLFSLILVTGVTMLLSTTEDAQFLMILFEATSAFGTVGLSMGLTPELTVFGKVLISLTMFAGRLGPITMAYALGPKKEKELYKLPEGKIIIG
nr:MULTISPECIES: TrkH family potassium uptake protein [unclassified Paenibacillus]